MNRRDVSLSRFSSSAPALLPGRVVPKSLAAALFAVAVSGCAVGPDYTPPDIAAPDHWLAAPGVKAAPAKQPSASPEEPGAAQPSASQIDQWWNLFSDRALNELIEKAVGDERNFDLRIASARVRAARAQLQITRAPWFPSIDYSATVQRSRISPNSLLGTAAGNSGGGFSFLPGLTNNLFSMGFDAIWELDFFGKTRRAVEAQEALLDSVEEERNRVLVTLTAEIAQNYFDYRANVERLDAIERNIATQRDSLSLTESRFKAGMTSQLDVFQAQAQLATTESQRPVLQYARDQARNRLAVLSGDYPEAIAQFFDQHRGSLPDDIRFVPAMLPSEVLKKRPDVRSAERRLAAATADIGVATAAFFPDFSLALAGSLQSRDSKNWIEWASRSWSIAPKVSLPIFQGGRILGAVDAANASQEEAFENYRKTIALSVEEVENSIAAYRREQERYESLSRAFAANHQSTEVSRQLYREGLADFLRVLESQRSLFATEDLVITTKAARITSLIALFKALGGGWYTPEGSEFAAPVAGAEKPGPAA